MMDRIPLIIICGPTASGKTKFAVDLAERFDGEIISADSMQVYRHMDIGTAKPTPEEKRGIPHHLMDFLEPDESFSVARFAELAHETIKDIYSRNKLPMMAGGTGLYIQAVADNIKYTEMSGDSEFREGLRAKAEKDGNEAVWEQLREVDPELAEKLHPNNLGRIIRALEVFRATGVPMSRWQTESKREPSPYRLLMLGLDYPDRGTLYARINLRVDEMLRSGLIDETRSLLDHGFSGTASQAIGYKELIPHIRGDASIEEAGELLKMETRRYAKRQLTWLRRDKRILWLNAGAGYDELISEAADIVSAFLKGKSYPC